MAGPDSWMLPAIAEIGWSPESTHNWTSFNERLAAQGPRWTAAGIGYYAAPGVPWPSTPAAPPANGAAGLVPRPTVARG